MAKTLSEYAYNLLARKRYTVAEIRKKLLQKHKTVKLGTPEEIEEIIGRLLEYKYLDDSSYAKAFTEDMLNRKPQGLRLIRLNLKRKGIPETLIQNTLNQADVNEEILAGIALQKKEKLLMKFSPQKRKEKLYRFLVSRGFRTDIILKVLS